MKSLYDVGAWIQTYRLKVRQVKLYSTIDRELLFIGLYFCVIEPLNVELYGRL